MSSSSSTSESSEAVVEEPRTQNEGEVTEVDEEAPAASALRGQAGLMTWACPREYLRSKELRLKRKEIIPEDWTTAECLDKVRRCILKNLPVKLEKGTCHDEPHKRVRESTLRRERHKHLAFLMSAPFAHQKLAKALFQEYGIRVSFSFQLKRFGANVRYCMEEGKKPSTDLDMCPATFPLRLDVQKEMGQNPHPGDAPVREGRKRKRLSFDEVSNIILEGVGDGPLITGKMLEQAAKRLKIDGKVELWNYVGELKDAAAVDAVVAKVWRLQGQLRHPLWCTASDHSLRDFNFDHLEIFGRC